jgi:hypothetical protein
MSTQPQVVETLCHPDEVSGTTVLSDGRRLHWTEGFSDVVIAEGFRGGVVGRIEAGDSDPLLGLLDDAFAAGHSQRPMTDDEAADWAGARSCV